jgi:hopanoid biosynthesis associated RND transporter like protein HpnN
VSFSKWINVVNAIKRILEGWIDVVCRFAWGVIIAICALTYVLFTYTAHNLTINTDTTDMLSEELPFRQHYIAYKEAFPQDSDLITVVVEAVTPDRADVAALALAARLRQLPAHVEKLYDFAGEDFFRRNGLLYRDVEELEKLADRLSQAQGLLGALSDDTSLHGLSNVLGLAIDDKRDGHEPIGDLARVFGRIADVVAARRASEFKELSWQSMMSDEAPKPSDLRRFLQVRVNADWSSLSPATPAMDAIRDTARKLELTPENGVRVRLTGGLALSTEELSSVFEGTKTASLLSLAMVSLCLFFGLRSVVLVGATIVTLVCGLIWTAGFATFAVGHLNLLSVAFAVLFIGLGVDFGIHFALRYAEESQGAVDRATALRRAAMGVGGAMTLCAVSAAIGFYAFLPTAYLGLAELGLISGTSMFIALFMSLTLLPALLAVVPLRSRPASPKTEAAPATVFFSRHGGKVSVAVAVTAFCAAWITPQVRFDFDPLNLQDPNTESLQTTLELIRDSETSPKTISIIRPSLDEARALAAKLAALEEVAKAVSVTSFVPGEQKDKLAIIGNLAFILLPVFDTASKKPLPSAAKERAALVGLSEKLGGVPSGEEAARLRRELNAFLAEAKDDTAVIALRGALLGLYPRLVGQLQTALEAGEVGLLDIPPELRERFLSTSGIARIEVTPAFSVEDNAALRRFIVAVQAIAPKATDSPVVILEASRAVVGAILQAAVTAGVLVFLMLFGLLRSLRDTLLVFYPLVVAGLMTVATAVLFDLPFNFANVIVLPLLMGLGVASGIHLVMRSRDALTGIAMLRTSTPRAVAFSALTTILSFGSLSVSTHRGTASMGVLLTIAIGFTLLGGLIALPALMGWLDARRSEQT